MGKSLFVVLIVIIAIVVCVFLFKKPCLKVGATINGFKITEKEIVYNNGRKDTVLTLKHEKTDAILTYIINNDEHRFFNISFNVPTLDKTGVAHIIEHAVLSSSRKYKDTDLFFNLAKKTPATFLNAGTDEGQVYYYFQTLNNQDFMNLMDIYMEASLFPEISKRIFQKEGWRLVIDKNENLSYNGVVYNEMKTAYSKTMYHWRYETLKQLFPRLEFESGGNPQNIPDLTYDKFVEKYKQTHNPSNAFVVLYGKGNIKKELAFLDKEFSEFEKSDKIILDYKNKALTKPAKSVISYPAGKGEDKSVMVFAFIVGDASDVVALKKFSVLKFLLAEYDEAPLKKVFLEQNLATEIDVEIDRAKDKLAFYVILEGVAKNNEEKVEKLLNETLAKLAKTGFEDKAEEAGKSIQKFEIKEENRFEFTQGGKIYDMYSTYLFGGDYKNFFKGQEFFDAFEKEIDEKNVWAKIIKTLFVDNQQKTQVIMRPDENMFAKYDKQTMEKLADLKSKMSVAEIEKLKAENKEFDALDSVILEADFPVLKLSQWVDGQLLADAEINEYQGAKIIYHKMEASGLSQFVFAFDIKNVAFDKLPVIGVFDLLSDKLDTFKNSNEDFILKQNIVLGREIDSELLVSPAYDGTMSAYYIVNMQAFGENVNQAFELLEEALFDIKYSDEKKIKEIITREVEKYEILFRQSGKPVFDDYSNESIMNSYIAGEKQYLYLKKMLANWDSEYGKLLLDLNYLKNNLLVKNNLVVDVVASNDKKVLEKFIDKLGNGEIQDYQLETIATNQARIVPARNSQNFMKCKIDKNPLIPTSFITSFVTYSYLYPEVRIKGGAYGSKVVFLPNGETSFSSWADPNIESTFKTFNQTSEFLKDFTMKESDFTGVKINVLASYLSPKTSFEKGAHYLRNYLLKRDKQMLMQEYNNVKALEVNDIAKIGEIFKNCKNSVIATIGPEKDVQNNKQLYDEIK